MARILLVVQRLWQGGGTETHVISLAAGLNSRGHSVGIFTSGGPWTRLAESAGIRVHVPSRGFDAHGLQSVIHRYGYGIVHVHDGRSLSLVERLRSPRPRILFTVHGLYVHRATLSRAGSVANAILAVSPVIQRYLYRCGVSPRKVHVVPNGIPTRVFRPRSHGTLRTAYGIPDHAFVVGYAGRFTYDKVNTGKRIARILSDYATRHRDVYVLVAGRNSRQSVRSSRGVIVVGHVARMELFYNSCNLMIGTGRVALESLSCGVPTLAIGHSDYFGLITSGNLKRAIDTNFGDHIPFPTPWGSSTLIHDLRIVHHSRVRIKRDTQIVSHRIRRLLSVDNIVQQTLRIYRV